MSGSASPSLSGSSRRSSLTRGLNTLEGDTVVVQLDSDEKKLAELEAINIRVKALSVVVIGASGDLARKKTYPALFRLHLHNLLPRNTIIYGYARSKMEDGPFKARISSLFPKTADPAECLLSLFETTSRPGL